MNTANSVLWMKFRFIFLFSLNACVYRHLYRKHSGKEVSCVLSLELGLPVSELS